MKTVIAAPEIIDDLLTENWELRWQVLEIFYRVQSGVRNHARTSKERQEVSRLGKKLSSTLNGPNDRNLQLIMTAAYFLGNNDFIFKIFSHLGIDDDDDFYPGLSKIKRELSKIGGKLDFFDYFLALISSQTGVERTTAIATTLAINLFSPAKALELIIATPNPEVRSSSLDLLQEAYPEYCFNEFIFANKFTHLNKFPELIRLIAPPLNHQQFCKCNAIISSLIPQMTQLEPSIAAAIGRLQLNECLPLLNRLDDGNLMISTVRACLGEQESCNELLAASHSWQRKKRLAAIPGIAFINSLDAVTQLIRRARKGDRHERHLALAALALNHHPKALEFLILALKEAKSTSERRHLLSLLTRHPEAREDSITANLLSQWHHQEELLPELFEALSVFGYGDKWEAILCNYKTPLQPEQKKIALFMARFADRPAIRRALIDFLNDIDWSFSFKLLSLLKPHYSGKEFKLLLNLLEYYETGHNLTIRERLTQGDDITNFSAALGDFLNHNQATAEKMISRFISELLDGSLASGNELKADFIKQPDELKKLFLETCDPPSNRPQASLPLLHMLRLLTQTSLEGCSSLATVVHRTRKYNGYFRQTISSLLSLILDRDSQLMHTRALPDLKEAIEFIRRRPHYDELREKILRRIATISRNAKDLKIYLGSAEDRSLRIISSKRLESEK